MFETVTVDDAIRRGYLTVNLPPVLLVIASIIISFLLTVCFNITFAIPFGIIAGIVAAILYRAFAIVKWRLWAFDQVRNVHELKQAAVRELLMNENGKSILDLSSAVQKQKWQDLQVKFSQPDVFLDDPSVPNETVITYSKGKKLAWSFMYVLMFCVGIYLFTVGKYFGFYMWGILLVLPGGGLAIVYIRDAFNDAPQIIINSKGISTAATPFYNWADISGEKTYRRGGGKTVHYYLEYNYRGGVAKFELDNFTVGMKGMDKLLKVYRGRNTQNMPGHN